MASSPKPLSPKNTFALIFGNIPVTWRFLEPSSRHVVMGLGLIAIFLAAFPVIRSGCYAGFINGLVGLAGKGGFPMEFVWVVLALLLVDMATGAFRTINRHLSLIIRTQLEKQIGLKLLEKQGSLDVATFEDPTKKSLLAKSENASWRLRDCMEGQVRLSEYALRMIFACGAILWGHPILFVVMILGCIPEMIVEFKVSRDSWTEWDKHTESRRKYFSIARLFGSEGPLAEMKIFQTLGYLLGIARERMSIYIDAEQKLSRKRLNLRQVVSFIADLSSAGVMVFAAWQVCMGGINLGQFTFLVSSVAIARNSTSSLFSEMARQYENALFVDDFWRMMNLEPVVKNPTDGHKLERIGEIVFDNVSFAYPGTDKNVLESVSLKISAGDKVALVGLNGSGKTTLVKLLCRFYDPTVGRITVNGYDLREIDLESYYAQMSAIFQDFLRYQSLTVGQSIAIGRAQTPYDAEGVAQAARDSEAYDFINELPNHFEQILGRDLTGGAGLSGGQWQKMALARTFYRHGSLIVLDEPTSAIDAQAEAHVFERIEQLGRDQTALFISHRFSTVRQADRIVVLERGKITEEGPHEKLLALSGSYARLYRLQAKAFE